MVQQQAPESNSASKQADSGPDARAWAVGFFFGDGARAGATIGALLLVVAVVTLVVILFQGGGSTRVVAPGRAATDWTPPSPPAAIESEGELREYILSRLFWLSEPTIYEDSIHVAFEEPEDSGMPKLAVVDEQGDAVAYSVPELLSEGAHLAGERVYVVGRLVSSVASPVHAGVPWTISSVNDAELSGPHNTGRVSALDLGGASSVGAIVYFRAVVAATGATAGLRPATYIIGLEPPKEAPVLGEVGDPNVAAFIRQLAH